jgi:hypothetical protein
MKQVPSRMKLSVFPVAQSLRASLPYRNRRPGKSTSRFEVLRKCPRQTADSLIESFRIGIRRRRMGCSTRWRSLASSHRGGKPRAQHADREIRDRRTFDGRMKEYGLGTNGHWRVVDWHPTPAPLLPCQRERRQP